MGISIFGSESAFLLKPIEGWSKFDAQFYFNDASGGGICRGEHPNLAELPDVRTATPPGLLGGTWQISRIKDPIKKEILGKHINDLPACVVT